MTSLPESLRDSVEAWAAEHGVGPTIRSTRAVGGGCINHGTVLRFESGEERFLKWNDRAPDGFFEAEAEGLEALRASVARTGAAIRVPEPVAHGCSPAGGWLLLEYVEPGPAGRGDWASLGRGLAKMHDAPSAEQGEAWGWHRDNWIGSLPQANPASERWADFWRNARVEPQLARARSAGYCTEADYDRLLERIPAALDAGIGPSQLHGDLWSGNAFFDRSGRPVLIDPASYRGHGEVDLAMTELFGGFGAGFYSAYAEVRPPDAGYDDHRRDLYQLYYLLVHVNLFGSSYAAASIAAARRVLAALG